ncbi:DUF4410 domain-containing protein [Acetobacteraceae bacterium KSS8]|uniref:DUF4410 domain-containing protein n=1 Tax=Endosaccharibacter trunci TaxID=2812733 RepID=A0ABT1W3V3_9PROT|nr:DUF4410 domain-containing protein [Acetobacteraceae bacterium KSS8]
MSRSMASTLLGALCATAVLAGCAAAHVDDLERNVTSLPPRTLAVVVASSTMAQAVADPAISRAIPDLQAALLANLSKAGVSAILATPGVPVQGPELYINVIAADPGNMVARTVIGFGAGRSRLNVAIALVDHRQAAGPDLAFNVDADSGRKPGLILPAGIAIGTANALHLAIGGAADLALNLRDVSSQDVRHTANAIAKHVVAYYREVGWLAPA